MEDVSESFRSSWRKSWSFAACRSTPVARDDQVEEEILRICPWLLDTYNDKRRGFVKRKSPQLAPTILLVKEPWANRTTGILRRCGLPWFLVAAPPSDLTLRSVEGSGDSC